MKDNGSKSINVGYNIALFAYSNDAINRHKERQNV